jgi:hypothetical protein
MTGARLAHVVRAAGVASLAWAVLTGQWVDAALFALVLLGLVLSWAVLGAVPVMDVLYGVVLLFAAWSAVRDLYIAYGWLDVTVHPVACGLTAVLAGRLLTAVALLPDAEPVTRGTRFATVLVTTTLGCTLGLVWEVGEWFGHTYLDRRIQVGYTDTLSDLVADVAGSLAAGLLLVATTRRLAATRPSAGGPTFQSASPEPGRDGSPSVSVVIPVRDDAVALEHCLRLLGRQTLAPYEVVVVDNGSTDDSAAVATRHGARVVTERVPGIPAAAAAGYDAARGDVIARCDADSRPPQDWVERIAVAMSAEPGTAALTGSGRFYDLPRWVAPLVSRAYLAAYYLLVHAALGHTTVWGSNMAVRRRDWLDVRHAVHRLDGEVHDDIDLAFALGPSRHVRYDRALVVGVSGRSVRGRRQLDRRLRRAWHTLRENWRDQPPWERWRATLRGPGTAGLADRRVRHG